MRVEHVCGKSDGATRIRKGLTVGRRNKADLVGDVQIVYNGMCGVSYWYVWCACRNSKNLLFVLQ